MMVSVFLFIQFQAQRNLPFGGVVVVELETYPRLRRSTTYPCFFFVARMMSEKRTHHLLRLNHPKAIAVTSLNITSPSHSHTPGSFQSSCLVGPTVWRSCGSSSMSIVPSFDGSNTLFCCCQVRARRHYSSTAWEQINRWGCKRHGGWFPDTFGMDKYGSNKDRTAKNEPTIVFLFRAHAQRVGLFSLKINP